MRAFNERKPIKGLVLGLAIMLFYANGGMAAENLRSVPLGEQTIVVGTAPYADELAITMVAKNLLERLGYNVEIRETTVGLWFAGIAQGDIDLGLNAWLPVTHGDYYEKYRDKLLDLGIVYEPTKLGWVVPAYIPKEKLNSIPDLKDPNIKDKFNGVITGISPGAGLQRLSRKAMSEYGLSDYGYVLLDSSGPGMTAALARAIRRNEWIVVTGWTPHWKWARWDLRYLKDPKGLLGKEGVVKAVASLGFPERFPRSAAFVENFTIPVADVEAIMNKAALLDEEGVSSPYVIAAKEYLDSHPDRIAQWLGSESAVNGNESLAGRNGESVGQ